MVDMAECEVWRVFLRCRDDERRAVCKERAKLIYKETRSSLPVLPALSPCTSVEIC
jgi:hypothetical protein